MTDVFMLAVYTSGVTGVTDIAPNTGFDTCTEHVIAYRGCYGDGIGRSYCYDF